MKVLMVFGTTEGQTEKIFNFLKEEIKRKGNEVKLVNANQDSVAPQGYDAVIVGGSMHTGTYQDSIRHYILDHAQQLKQVPNVFVSVSLSSASHFEETRAELEEHTESFLSKVSWQPDHVEQVAGALRFTEYNWLKKIIMTKISNKEGHVVKKGEDLEFTDWDQVRGIAAKLSELVPH